MLAALLDRVAPVRLEGEDAERAVRLGDARTRAARAGVAAAAANLEEDGLLGDGVLAVSEEDEVAERLPRLCEGILGRHLVKPDRKIEVERPRLDNDLPRRLARGRGPPLQLGRHTRLCRAGRRHGRRRHEGCRHVLSHPGRIVGVGVVAGLGRLGVALLLGSDHAARALLECLDARGLVCLHACIRGVGSRHGPRDVARVGRADRRLVGALHPDPLVFKGEIHRGPLLQTVLEGEGDGGIRSWRLRRRRRFRRHRCGEPFHHSVIPPKR
mmetsp:Transcript_11438/g.26901  ORF Transcript_11438/g.26901 Transcript_11438/m.26901 type:complete len:270 (+) Transcript_11438:346-1155(+)